MPTGSKGSKLLRYIDHRLRVSLVDGRTIVGTFLAFDKHLNLVLVDAEEYRHARRGGPSSNGNKKKNATGSAIIEERVEKRTLGLIILRGENVVSVAVDGPPPPRAAAASSAGGPGVARGVGRGALPPPAANGGSGGAGRGGRAAAAPMGLGAAPVHGVGGMMGMHPPPPPPPGGMGMMPPPPGMMGRGMPPPGMGRGGGY